MGLRVVSRRDAFSPRAAHSAWASGRIPSQREIAPRHRLRRWLLVLHCAADCPWRRRYARNCPRPHRIGSIGVRVRPRGQFAVVYHFLSSGRWVFIFAPRSTADGLCGLKTPKTPVLKPTRSLVRKPPASIASESTRAACASFAGCCLHC